MQVKKTRFKKNILVAARREFAKHSFHDSSIIKISKNAEVTLSNIYNYFDSKDEIFKALLQPTIDSIENGMVNSLNIFFENIIDNKNLQWYKDYFQKIFKFIDANRDLFEILFLQTQGSSLENYKESIIEKFSYVFDVSYKNFKSKHSELQLNISKFLWHNITIFLVNFLYEFIKNKPSVAETKKINEELSLIMFNFIKNLNNPMV